MKLSLTVKTKTLLLSFLALSLTLSTYAFSYEHPLQSDQKAIHYLLAEVEKSQGVFIRNAKEHGAKQAREHLAHKLKMAKKMFWFFGPEREVSLKEFVEKIASSSSTSGKSYHIRLNDGRTLTTGDWLRERIQALRRENKANQKTH